MSERCDNAGQFIDEVVGSPPAAPEREGRDDLGALAQILAAHGWPGRSNQHLRAAEREAERLRGLPEKWREKADRHDAEWSDSLRTCADELAAALATPEPEEWCPSCGRPSPGHAYCKDCSVAPPPSVAEPGERCGGKPGEPGKVLLAEVPVPGYYLPDKTWGDCPGCSDCAEPEGGDRPDLRLKAEAERLRRDT